MDAVVEVYKLEASIKKIGDEIRLLKEQLKIAPSDEAKKDLQAKVDLLLQLKNALPSGHPLRPEERAKDVEKQRSVRREKKPYRLLPESEIETHLVQRKIHNVFAKDELSSSVVSAAYPATTSRSKEDSGGADGEEEEEEIDRDAGYRLDKNRFNSEKTGLDFCSGSVIATEKWDGTTLQATRHGIFKRRDIIPKGDPRKFDATQEERYTLIEIDITHPWNKHLRNAIGEHVAKLKNIPEGITVYFEAVGPKIQPRFRDGFPKTDSGAVRVFDTSRNGDYLKFEETQEIAKLLGLPIVHHWEFASSSNPKLPEDVVGFLLSTHKEGKSYSNAPELKSGIPLEGYVFRSAQNPNHIAKLRVCDLEPLGLN